MDELNQVVHGCYQDNQHPILFPRIYWLVVCTNLPNLIGLPKGFDFGNQEEETTFKESPVYMYYIYGFKCANQVYKKCEKEIMV